MSDTPVLFTPSGPPETVLPDPPSDAMAELVKAQEDSPRLGYEGSEVRSPAFASVCARWPAYVEAWAKLGQALFYESTRSGGRSAGLTGSAGSGDASAGLRGSARSGGGSAGSARSGGGSAGLPGSGDASAELTERPQAEAFEDVARVKLASAYAAFRTGYHRGLDQLRGNGWRGSGWVRWKHPSNRGFLLALDGLRNVATRLGEDDEAQRCSHFLAQLDPDWPPDDLEPHWLRATSKTPG